MKLTLIGLSKKMIVLLLLLLFLFPDTAQLRTLLIVLTSGIFLLLLLFSLLNGRINDGNRVLHTIISRITAKKLSRKKNEIRHLISVGNVGQAIQYLLAWSKNHPKSSDILKEVLIISFSFQNLEKDFRQGLIEYQEFERLRRSITYHLLNLVESFQ